LQKIIDYLLQNGGESIQYRTRREILGEPPDTKELKQLQQKILLKPRVRKILAAQQEDGWMGSTLHGSPPDGFDSNVWFLLNFGVERDHPSLQKAVNALLRPSGTAPYKTTFPGGPALDADGRGGDRSVFALTLASLACESNEVVASEVDLSLDHFRVAAAHSSLDDFSTCARPGGRRYYKPGARFPGANHMQLLASTRGWRTSANVAMVRDSFGHCMNLMKLDPQMIWFRHKTHFIGPFNFNWSMFPFSFERLEGDSYAFVWWLRALHRLATIGFVQAIPELAREYETLKTMLEDGQIYSRQTEMSLRRFKSIWSIEDAWRQKQQVKSDLFFAALLALNKAGYQTT